MLAYLYMDLQLDFFTVVVIVTNVSFSKTYILPIRPNMHCSYSYLMGRYVIMGVDVGALKDPCRKCDMNSSVWSSKTK